MIGYEEFYDLYHTQNLHLKDIAAKYDCSVATAGNWRKKLGIKPKLREHCLDDLSGQRFGLWTVLRKTGYSKDSNNKLWLCKCLCGHEVEIERTRLVRCKSYKTLGYKNFSYRSPKCPKCGRTSAAFYEAVPNYYWTKIINGAKKRNLEVTVTPEFCRDLFIKQNEKCAITGVPLHWARSVKEFNKSVTTASLDRIDSSKGYTPDNIQWVHRIINNMKQALSQQEFKDWCRKVTEYENEQIYLG